jgi:DNA-binding transcriptional regulator YdaS (Cro superfamily)
MKKDPIIQIIAKAGGQARLGELIGVPQSTVSLWKVSGRGIPAERAVQLEKKTKGKFPRWESRPDLWNPPQDK